MRIVIDTNVLISGTFWSSASFQVLKRVDNGQLELVVSREILEEYHELLSRDEIMNKSAFSQEKSDAAAKMLKKAMLVEPLVRVRKVLGDPDDDKFIEAAIAGKAEHIISKDKDLLLLKEVQGIKVMTPDEFLAVVSR